MTGDNGVTGDTVTRLRALLAEDPDISRSELARRLGVSRNTVYKNLAKLGIGEAQPDATSPSPSPPEAKRKSNRGGPIGNKKAVGARGNRTASPPLRNKNAVTTGEHESLWLDLMTPDEQTIYTAPVGDDDLDKQIRMCDVRIYRMEQRLRRLRERAGEDGADRPEDALFVTDEESTDGIERGQLTRATTTKKRPLRELIQAQEEAITRIQQTRAGLLKERLRRPKRGDEGEKLAKLLEGMEAAARAALTLQSETS